MLQNFLRKRKKFCSCTLLPPQKLSCFFSLGNELALSPSPWLWSVVKLQGNFCRTKNNSSNYPLSHNFLPIFRVSRREDNLLRGNLQLKELFFITNLRGFVQDVKIRIRKVKTESVNSPKFYV